MGFRVFNKWSEPEVLACGAFGDTELDLLFPHGTTFRSDESFLTVKIGYFKPYPERTFA